MSNVVLFPFKSMENNTKLVVGQKVHSKLYGGRDGYISEVTPTQVTVIFADHISMVPSSLVTNSVQWMVYPEIVTGTQLEIFREIANNAVNAQLADKAHRKQLKIAEEIRQRTAPEYSHLTPCDSYNNTVTNKNIRAQLKLSFPGIKFSVTKESHSATLIKWTDGPAAKEVDAVIEPFKHVQGMEIDDSIIYKNTAWVFGSIDYIFTSHTHSDERVQDALDKINKHYGVNGTLEQYHNGSLTQQLTNNGPFHEFYNELRNVLNGEIDYDLEEREFCRREQVAKELIAQDAPVELINRMFLDNGTWTIRCSHFTLTMPESDATNHETAAALAILYTQLVYKTIQEEKQHKIRTALVKPVSVVNCNEKISCRFASAKINSLEEVDEELHNSFGEISKCVVMQKITLSPHNYRIVSESLLEDRINLFGAYGGFKCSADDLIMYECGSDEYRNAFNAKKVREVVAVVSSDGAGPFFVDSSGYSYARYVGRQFMI